jgi:hypothetical protein
MVLEKARSGQNILERLANMIPGLKGYREKELRRDSDRILREHLAKQLDECKKGLNDISNAALRAKQLDVINDVETARKRTDKLANRIRYADRGYAGFFDAVKVDDEKLGAVYEFDMGMVTAVDSIRSAERNASVASTDVATGVRAMIAEIDALDSKLSEREQILRGIN